MTSNSKTIVYYIHNRKLNIQELKQQYNSLTASISVVTNDDQEITIADLQSTQHGKGYAMHLLKKACKEALSNNIINIILDDCSDNYRQNHNIYTKMGLQYLEEYGPEMTGSVKHISEFNIHSTQPTIYKTYIDN